MRTSAGFVAVAVLVLLAAACGGGSSVTGPSANTSGGTGNAPTRSGNVTFMVVFSSVGGNYTATVNGTTYTASGGFTLSLPPGSTQEIAGTFRGMGFGVGFASVGGGGGAESGSLRVLTGPSPQTQSCSVLYYNIDTPDAARAFRLQFKVTNNVGSVCQAG